MTKLFYDAIRGSSGTADSIQLHASNQSVTFPGNVTCSGTATGFGKLRQISTLVTNTTEDTTTSTTLEDTNLTASIANVASGSKVIVFASHPFKCTRSDDNAGGGFALVRGSTVILAPQEDTGMGPTEYRLLRDGGGSNTWYAGRWNIAYLDESPGTGTVTYKTQFGVPVSSSSGTMIINDDGDVSGKSWMYMMEIGA